MPQYELCYILAAQVSDDLVPDVTSEIKSNLESFGATNIIEDHLGKKKLAYPIKKTKNGYYVVVRFSMPASNTLSFEAKLRTNNNVLRHLLLNIDEHLMRLEKDQVAQASLSQRRGEQPAAKDDASSTSKETIALELEPETSSGSLDEQIDAALSAEDIIK